MNRPAILNLPQRSWVLLMVVYMFAIICSSLLPGFDIVNQSYAFTEKFIRKCFHFMVYMGLAFLLVRSFNSMDLRSKTAAFVLAAVFGILNEFIEYYVPGRDCTVRDMILNATGSLTMILLLHTPWFKKWQP